MENNVYDYFNFESKSDDAFPVKKFKNIYNNVFEIRVNTDLLDFKTNAEHVEHQKHDDNNHTLIIPHIQKLEEDFEIEITTQDGLTKKITLPTSKFSMFFKNV